MPFCKNCGIKLDNDINFCPECGTPVKEQKKSTERKTVYEGEIHKCPCCGEVLESFCAVCPSCGYEIRNKNASTSVQELASKLEKISAQKMPVFEGRKSVMKQVFGKDFRENDEEEEALDRFEKQKDKEKASLIINFAVPNTKEDILEFMLLAISNTNGKFAIENEETKAWISKMDQVYKKAEILLAGEPEFEKIKNLYETKKKEQRIRVSLPFIVSGGLFALSFLMLFFMANPILTTLIVIGIVVIVINVLKKIGKI